MDGPWLSGSGAGEVTLWDVETGEEMCAWKGPPVRSGGWPFPPTAPDSRPPANYRMAAPPSTFGTPQGSPQSDVRLTRSLK